MESEPMVLKLLNASFVNWWKFCYHWITKDFEIIQLKLNYVYHPWLLKSGRKIALLFKIEFHGQKVTTPGKEVSEIEINILSPNHQFLRNLFPVLMFYIPNKI